MGPLRRSQSQTVSTNNPREIDDCACEEDAKRETSMRHWFEVAVTLIVLIALSQMIPGSGFFASVVDPQGIASLGTIFLIGLIAASSSCLALVGGLLLSVSAKWAEMHHASSRWEKFQPLALFNIGRLAGYFLFGGVIGLLGTALRISTHLTGYLTIALALVMIVLALNILKILPKRYCAVPLPQSLMRRIRKSADSKNPLVSGVLGALTFFIPCGFTQSMQLLALGSGSALSGAIIMFVFALGTLPSLMGISIVSALVEGRAARYFLTFSGSVVLLLGIVNLQSGLLLTGIDVSSAMEQLFTSREPSLQENDPFVTIDPQGRQIVAMYVTEKGYKPSEFTIDPHRETWIYAIANDRVSGCTSFLNIPSLNLTTPIRQGPNWLGSFTPKPGTIITATCSMGMFKAKMYVRS